MPDERFKAAYEAVMEDAEKARLVYAEKQKNANTMAAIYGVDPPFGEVESPSQRAPSR